MKNRLLCAALFAVVALTFTACSTVDKVGGWLYDPVVETNTVPVIVTGPDGVSMTNLVERVSTNSWVLRPGIGEAVSAVGDVAPFPWSGLAANGVLALLGIGAHLRGRQWKKAAEGGVIAADEFKRALKERDPQAVQAAKENLVRLQKADGTHELITELVRRLTK